MKSFLDPKTTSKIHVSIYADYSITFCMLRFFDILIFLSFFQVLGNKYQSKLLEIIDARFVMFNVLFLSRKLSFINA